MELMSVGKFAKRVGVNAVTLRKMEAKGGSKFEQIIYIGVLMRL